MMLDRALVYDRAYVALPRVKNLKEMRMTAQVQPHKTSSYCSLFLAYQEER
jgi:hypothetical protein